MAAAAAASGTPLPGTSPRVVAWGEEACAPSRCSQQSTPRMDSVIEEPVCFQAESSEAEVLEAEDAEAEAPAVEEQRPTRLRPGAHLEDFDSDEEAGDAEDAGEAGEQGVAAPPNLTDATMLFEDAASSSSAAPPGD